MCVSKDVRGLTCNVCCRTLACIIPWTVQGTITAKDFKTSDAKTFRYILSIAMCAAVDMLVSEDKKKFTKRRLL